MLFQFQIEQTLFLDCTSTHGSIRLNCQINQFSLFYQIINELIKWNKVSPEYIGTFIPKVPTRTHCSIRKNLIVCNKIYILKRTISRIIVYLKICNVFQSSTGTHCSIRTNSEIHRFGLFYQNKNKLIE